MIQLLRPGSARSRPALPTAYRLHSDVYRRLAGRPRHLSAPVKSIDHGLDASCHPSLHPHYSSPSDLRDIANYLVKSIGDRSTYQRKRFNDPAPPNARQCGPSPWKFPEQAHLQHLRFYGRGPGFQTFDAMLSMTLNNWSIHGRSDP
ncbi:hypothetical protein CC2G_009495 [Coprinopsis cinerea AmutBmut pab1-1]|nr:hypothetical protein CC2G_009495 [Coprinopsis cinerea AmutBmut pab1-1]